MKHEKEKEKEGGRKKEGKEKGKRKEKGRRERDYPLRGERPKARSSHPNGA